MVNPPSVQKILSGIEGHLQFLKEEGLTELDLPLRKQKEQVASLSSATPLANRNAKQKRDALLDLRQKVLPCRQCPELARTRKSVVFGTGNADATLCFVGEAPGQEEDVRGLPFVGKAGELLTKIIESIGLTREQVFIANVLKCRPPQNRNPKPEEIHNCEPFLLEQIAIIRPRIICALGTFAAQTLLKTELPISSLRGKFHDYHGIKLIPTFHPAYLLRNPDAKKVVWQDMKKIRGELSAP